MPAEMPPIKKCKRPECGEMFFETRSDKEFCSAACAKSQWYRDVINGRRQPRQRGARAETQK